MSKGAIQWMAAVWCAAIVAVAHGRQKPVQWTVVRTSHFTVLTEGKAETAQRWAGDLERFRIGLGEIMPANAARLEPVTVLVFRNEAEFRPYKMMRKGRLASVAGYFARVDSINAIGLAQDSRVAETRRTIFHEATHWFLHARTDVFPAWVEEGIAEVFSTLAEDEKGFAIGDAIADHVEYLSRHQLPSLAELVTTASEELDYSDDPRTHRFYAGAWLFVHWAMFGQGSVGSDGLRGYLEALQAGRSDADAFRAGFGGDYATVEARLREYLKNGRYVRHRFPWPATPVSIGPAEKASEADVEYAVGALLLGGHGPAEALPHLERVLALEPEKPRGWEAVGIAKLHAGDKAAARSALERAIAAGSQRALVWNNVAALQEEDLHLDAGPIADGHMLGKVAEEFRHALELDPICEAAYAGLGGIEYAVEPFAPDDVNRLERGRQLFPANRMIALGAASARLRSAHPGDAREALARITAGGGAADRRVRELAGQIIEEDKLRALNRDVAAFTRDGRHAELLVEIDAALRDPAIGEQNRARLQLLRKEVDQMRRISAAVSDYNSGQTAKAIAALHQVRDESPATEEIRKEVDRLLGQVDPAPEAAP